MSLLQTGRQAVTGLTDAAGRTARSASRLANDVRARVRWTAARVRGVFARTENRLDAIGGTCPFCGSTYRHSLARHLPCEGSGEHSQLSERLILGRAGRVVGIEPCGCTYCEQRGST